MRLLHGDDAWSQLGFIDVERSLHVLRDLDLQQAIDERAVAVVAFSIIYTPDSAQSGALREMERLAPPPEKCFAAMERLACAGILTGTCMMPILPELCDDDANLQYVVKWAAEHGGQFVNKRIVEALANQVQTMELNSEPSRLVWAYRKAAWAIEDTPQDLGLIYRQMGVKGLEGIENVGPKLAQVVEPLVRQWA